MNKTSFCKRWIPSSLRALPALGALGSLLFTPAPLAGEGTLTLDATNLTSIGGDFASPILIDGYYTLDVTDLQLGRQFEIDVSVDTTNMPATGIWKLQAVGSTAGGTIDSRISNFTDITGTAQTFYGENVITGTSYALDVEVRLVDASVEDFAEGSYDATITFTYKETWT